MIWYHVAPAVLNLAFAQLNSPTLSWRRPIEPGFDSDTLERRKPLPRAIGLTDYRSSQEGKVLRGTLMERRVPDMSCS